jgi:hypothetical protein
MRQGSGDPCSSLGRLAACALLAAAPACDDGASPGQDVHDADAAEAPEDVEAAEEADDGADGEAAGAWSTTLVVLTSDYTSGGISLIDVDTVGPSGTVVAVDVATAHSDAHVVCGEAGVFDVVERVGADRIVRLRAAAGEVAEVATLALETGSNPQDALPLTTGEIAVPLYERTALAFAAGDLSATATTVDLAPLADTADGLPEMFRAVESGGRLYVSLQLLDRTGATWTPTGPGVLAVVDPAAHALIDADAGTAGVQGIALAGANPIASPRLAGPVPAVFVATVGAYGANDGGIEAVDLATGATRGFLITEEALGGDVTDFLVFDDDTGVAIVTAGFTTDLLVRIDLDAGDTVGDALLVNGGFTLSGLVDLGGGRIAVGDRTAGAAGVRAFDVASETEVTAGPIDVGLPPVTGCVLP